jgi:hypothetical protein
MYVSYKFPSVFCRLFSLSYRFQLWPRLELPSVSEIFPLALVPIVARVTQLICAVRHFQIYLGHPLGVNSMVITDPAVRYINDVKYQKLPLI